jgi:hypothetical protein
MAAWIPLIAELEPEVQALIEALVRRLHRRKAAPAAAVPAASGSGALGEGAKPEVPAAKPDLSSHSLDADEPTTD